MAIFEVEITRNQRLSATINVEADSANEAEDKALAEADNMDEYDFTVDSCDDNVYCISLISENEVDPGTLELAFT